MKIIKVAQIETTDLYVNKELLLEELREGKRNGVNINEYNISHEGNSYKTIVDFLRDKNSKKYDAEIFKTLLQEKILSFDQIVSFSIVDEIPNYHKLDLDFGKISEVAEKLKSSKFAEVAATLYPELAQKKLVINVKSGADLKEVLGMSYNFAKTDFTTAMRENFNEAAYDRNTQKTVTLDIRNMEVRNHFHNRDGYFSEDNQFHPDDNIQHKALLMGLDRFSEEKNIQKAFFNSYPANEQTKQNVITKYISSYGMDAKNTITQFAINSNFLDLDMKQDYTKEAVFHNFNDVVKAGNWTAIETFYNSLNNKLEGLHKNQTSGYRNPFLFAPSTEIFDKMLEKMPEFLNGKHSALYKLEDVGKSGNALTIIENFHKFPNHKDGINIKNLVILGVKNGFTKEVFTQLTQSGINISKLPDYSLELFGTNTDEQKPGSNIMTALEFGYNPSKIDAIVSKAVEKRDKKIITALKTTGVANLKSNMFLNSLVKNNLTSIFHSYFPDVLTENILNSKNSDGTLLWWNVRDSSFLAKVKNFHEKNPGVLKSSTSDKSILDSTFTHLYSNDYKGSALKILEIAVENKVKNGQQIEVNVGTDTEGKNFLHKAFVLYNFIGYNGGERLKLILEENITNINFDTCHKLLSQKDNQDSYPMDYLIDLKGGNSKDGVDNNNKPSSGSSTLSWQFKTFLSTYDTDDGKALIDAMMTAPNSHNIDSGEYILKMIKEICKDDALLDKFTQVKEQANYDLKRADVKDVLKAAMDTHFPSSDDSQGGGQMSFKM